MVNDFKVGDWVQYMDYYETGNHAGRLIDVDNGHEAYACSIERITEPHMGETWRCAMEELRPWSPPNLLPTRRADIDPDKIGTT